MKVVNARLLVNLGSDCLQFFVDFHSGSRIQAGMLPATFALTPPISFERVIASSIPCILNSQANIARRTGNWRLSMSTFIDIGANLLDPCFQGRYNGNSQKHEPDLDAVLERARTAGVEKVF